MTTTQLIGVALVIWCCLSVPVGILVGKFITAGKGKQRNDTANDVTEKQGFRGLDNVVHGEFSK